MILAVLSPVEMVIRGNRWRVRVAELARWVGVDQATLHRWRDVETFARARGVAPELLRALAPRAWRLTRDQAALVRSSYEHDGVVGSTHALAIIAMLPIEPPPPRPPTPARSRFGPRPRRAARYRA